MLRNILVLLSIEANKALLPDPGWDALKGAINSSGNTILNWFSAGPSAADQTEYKPLLCMGEPKLTNKEYFSKLDRTLVQSFGQKAESLRCVPHRPGFMDYNISWFVSLMSKPEQTRYYKIGQMALQDFDKERLKNPLSHNVPIRMIYLHLLHLTLSKYLFPPHALYQRIYQKVFSVPPLRLRGVIEQGFTNPTPGVWELALKITFAVEVLEWGDEIIELLSLLFYQYTLLLETGKSPDNQFDIEEDVKEPLIEIVSLSVQPQTSRLERLLQRVEKLKRRIVSEL